MGIYRYIRKTNFNRSPRFGLVSHAFCFGHYDFCGNVYQRKNYNTLSSFSAGKEIILRAVGDSSASLLTMLNEKNITLGTTFNISKVEDFDKTMIVSYGKARNISLSHEVCKRLLVETV